MKAASLNVRKMSRSSSLSNRAKKHHRGQALLELAFVLPILIVLALGVIEVGRYAYIAILIGNAARAGAAYGAQGHAESVDTSGILSAANNDFAGAAGGPVTNGQPISALTVTSVIACGCDNVGTITSQVCDSNANPNAGSCVSGHWVVTVSVTTTGTFNSLFNYPGIPASLTITRTASLPVA